MQNGLRWSEYVQPSCLDSSQNRSFRVLSSALAMAMHRCKVGLYPPFSMRPMVWRVTSTFSASSACVRLCSTRASFNLILRFTLTSCDIFIWYNAIISLHKVIHNCHNVKYILHEQYGMVRKSLFRQDLQVINFCKSYNHGNKNK